jgi:UDPglucose 6-dehydrogenase
MASRCESAHAALNGADALAIVTEWQEFRSPDFQTLKESLADAVIFDGRNLYEPATVEHFGLRYYAIGRGAIPGAEPENFGRRKTDR